MFKTAPAVEPAPDMAPIEDLIPVSHLALDLPTPGDGWNVFLAGCGIEVLTDDLGRLSISRADAKRLFDDQREREARRAAVVAAADEAAAEYDREWRRSLRGVPADLIPPACPSPRR